MGSPLIIYNLYQLTGGAERYLLARCERPAFPNWNQNAEDAAIRAVEAQFASLIASQQPQLGFTDAKRIGTWEGAYPDGDVFYSNQSNIPIEVWMTTETVYGRYIAFGIAASEEAFWSGLHELYVEGDLWSFEAFARPATRKRVWLVQTETA